ncbi:MAG: ATP-binding protein, partial [Pseudonocardia sp.]
TNVVRHAGRASAEVVIDYHADDVSVVVRDTGTGRSAASVPGRGLRGLRERVEQLHGTFAAAQRPAGGYEVAATIPNTGVGR